MRLRWKASALADLEQIAEHYEALNPRATRRMVGEVRRQVSLLSRNPQIGRIGRVAGTRELVISATPFVVAYEDPSPGDRFLSILAIVDARMLWPEEFPEDE